MNLFSKVKNILTRGYQNLTNKFVAQNPQHNISTPAPKSGNRMLSFGMSYQASRAYGNIFAALSIMGNRTVVDNMLHAIGTESVRELKNLTKPIEDTGGFSNSFDYRIDRATNSVTIYNDHRASTAIHDGIQGYPSGNVIRNWVQSRGISIDPDQTENEASYLIWRSIVRSTKTSNKSTIGNMNPTGKRAYHYMRDLETSLRSQILPAFQNLGAP